MKLTNEKLDQLLKAYQEMDADEFITFTQDVLGLTAGELAEADFFLHSA